jgi:hypothetical protein
VAARLIDRGVRATWFITHDSPAIRRLRAHPELFELGIHPNFLPNSTQGANPHDVLTTCLALVPGARSMRTHGLVQSTPLLDLVLRHAAIQTDVSIFLPHAPRVEPAEYWWQGRMLLRIPYVWEDDFEMERPQPCWNLTPLLDRPGIRIVDFHPIHVYLNSADLRAYTSLKQRCPVVGCAEPGQVNDLVNRGNGAGTAFDELIVRLAGGGGRCVSEFHDSRLAGAPPE